MLFNEHLYNNTTAPPGGCSVHYNHNLKVLAQTNNILFVLMVELEVKIHCGE